MTISMTWVRVIDEVPCSLDAHVVTLTGDGSLVLLNRAQRRTYSGGRVRISEGTARARAVEILREHLQDRFNESKEFRKSRTALVHYFADGEDPNMVPLRPTWQVMVSSGLVLINAVTGQSMGFMATKGGVNPTRPEAAHETKPAAERRPEPSVAIPVAAGAGVAGLTAVWRWRRRKL